MRAKRPYIVLSFHATVEAMAWEKHCTEANIPGRLIPLPRELSAGCGLALPFSVVRKLRLRRKLATCVADAAGGLAAVAVKA